MCYVVESKLRKRTQNSKHKQDLYTKRNNNYANQIMSNKQIVNGREYVVLYPHRLPTIL